MSNEHNCLHEEQILGQSKAIAELSAELNYKKERLDDLKEDNRRMEHKIDKMNNNLIDFINDSDTKDTELNNRLIKIETRQEVQDKTTKDNQDKVKTWIAIVTVVFLVLTFYFNFIK